MKSGVGAVIASVVWDMGSGVVRSKEPLLIAIMLAAFVANYYFEINVIIIILIVIAIGVIRTLFPGASEGGEGMICIQLFFAFLQIGAFSFGGGYAAMPLIQAQVIEKYGWLTVEEFTNLITISEMTPGPIAINSATFVGNQVAGIPGALAATVGCILPSCIFVTLLAWIYIRYRNLSLLQGTLTALRPAVVAMIANAGLTILIPAFFKSGLISFAQSNFQLRPVILFIGALDCCAVLNGIPCW